MSGVWWRVEHDDQAVVVGVRRADDGALRYPEHVWRVSPAAAVQLAIAIVTHAVELDHDAAQLAAVLEYFRPELIDRGES